jgi:hypothetical protein
MIAANDAGPGFWYARIAIWIVAGLVVALFAWLVSFL